MVPKEYFRKKTTIFIACIIACSLISIETTLASKLEVSQQAFFLNQKIETFPSSELPNVTKKIADYSNNTIILPIATTGVELNLSNLKNDSLYTKSIPLFSKSNKITVDRGLGWEWMDFNPGGGSIRNGGLFEGYEATQWFIDKYAWQDDDPFDNTDEYIPEWSPPNELYSYVRTDEDLQDGTSQKGAWCTAAGENSFWPSSEDSRGYATCELDFDIEDFIDISPVGFNFIHAPSVGYGTFLYCDYMIDGVDFDDPRDHVYFNIYLDDGTREWPIGYNHHTGENDMPKNNGWCTNFWDPEYAGKINPFYFKDDYSKDFIVNYTGGNTMYGYVLNDFLNNHPLEFTLRFELYIRLYGEYFDNEYFKFWVDNAAIKLSYWYDDAPYVPHTPTPSDNAHYVPSNTDLSWYGGDPDDYIIPSDSVNYKIYLGTDSNPNYVDTIGPFPANNQGPFYWTPPGGLVYDEHYYWKIVAEDSYGLMTSSDIWEFWTENTPPTQPVIPSGSISGWHGSSYQYLTSATDLENHMIQYGWDWGEGSTVEWTGFYTSGETCSTSHTWVQPGVYDIKVQARDELGAESPWSQILSVLMGNRAPMTPSTPSGPIIGWHGIEYTYTTNAIDPDGDNIKYYFDWGDGSGGWTNLYPSGITGNSNHTWSIPGTYAIKAKAQDEYGDNSSYSNPSLSVYMGNRPPDIPNSPIPGHGDDWVEIDTLLEWNCVDPDSDILSYNIYFGSNNPPPLVKTNHTLPSFQPGTLEPNTYYYWMIEAYDAYGAITIGPLWEFLTREYTSPELTAYAGWTTGVDKQWGTCREYFTFKVHYFDPDGDEPDIKAVVIDSTFYDMQCCTPDPTDGDYFVRIQGKVIGGGQHFYYFYFDDGTISDGVRFPESYDWDFTVNYPPEPPGVSGQRKISVNVQYKYSAVTFDLDGDTVYYWFDWGDGTNSGWVGPLQSGETAEASHSWFQKGDYSILVCARDHPHGDIGENGSIMISVPRIILKSNIPLLNIVSWVQSPVLYQLSTYIYIKLMK